LEHILLGSTAERVIRAAPCPVLAVRLGKMNGKGGTQGTGGPVRIKRVLVPVDFSGCSLDALEYAAQLGLHVKATITLLHVMEPVAYGLDFSLGNTAERDQQRERIKVRLGKLTAALRSSGLTVDQIARGGLPTDAILEIARVQASDIVVMGTHGRRGISHVVSGSVAEAVLRKAACPVLTVRSPKFSPSHRRVIAADLVHPTDE
jgi:nucleotide-binding universal stress UspA family protein